MPTKPLNPKETDVMTRNNPKKNQNIDYLHPRQIKGEGIGVRVVKTQHDSNKRFCSVFDGNTPEDE